MKKRIALLAVLAGVVAAPAATAAPRSMAPAAVVRTCGAGYVHAYLPWGEKCLRAGQYCKVGNAAYRRYGFVCLTTGHLRRR